MGQTWYSKIAKQRAEQSKIGLSKDSPPLKTKGHPGDDPGHTHKEEDVEGNFKNKANESVKVKTNTVFDAGTAKVEGVEGQAARTRLSWSDAWKSDLEGIRTGGGYADEAAYRADMKGQTDTAEKKKKFEAGVTAATGLSEIGFTPEIEKVDEVAAIDPRAIGQTHTETIIEDTVEDPQVWNAGLTSTIQGNMAEGAERRGQKRSDRRSVRDTYQNMTKDDRKKVRQKMRKNRKDGVSKKGRLNQRADAISEISGTEIDFARHQSAKNKTTKGNKAYEDRVVTGSQNKNASPKDMYSGGGADETINKQASEDATVFVPQTDFSDSSFGKTDPPTDLNPVNVGKPAYKLKNTLKNNKRGVGY